MGNVRSGRPLPLVPAGSVMIGAAVALVENDDGGLVLIWGMAASCWASGDVAGRRLAAVSLVVTGSARHYEVAGGFGVNSDTLRDWRRSWERDGIDGLRPGRRGPKGPSKLTPELAAVGATLGVSPDAPPATRPRTTSTNAALAAHARRFQVSQHGGRETRVS